MKRCQPEKEKRLDQAESREGELFDRNVSNTK